MEQRGSGPPLFTFWRRKVIWASLCGFSRTLTPSMEHRGSGPAFGSPSGVENLFGLVCVTPVTLGPLHGTPR
eukprot:10413028-Karenia_brevis.AAC.1